jgi:hypothetical protein
MGVWGMGVWEMGVVHGEHGAWCVVYDIIRSITGVTRDRTSHKFQRTPVSSSAYGGRPLQINGAANRNTLSTAWFELLGCIALNVVSADATKAAPGMS